MASNFTDADWEWPPALRVFCEEPGSIIPGVAEFFNAASALTVIAAGLVPMLTSPFVDELTDLASAACAINGLFSLLVHAFPNRFLGTIDYISILLMNLLYLKTLLITQYPVLLRSPVKHALISLALVLIMLVGFAWTKYNIPTALAELVDPVLVTGPGSGVIMLFIWAKLMTNDATWHLGKLKRTIIRGFLALLLATTFWVLEEAGAIPCPSVLTLHPLWHIFSAHALLCMTSFCKYHRGRLFGFNVELRGHWLCPYTVWLEPESTDRNPIVRHTSSVALPVSTQRGTKRMSITAIAGDIAGKVPIPRKAKRGSVMGAGNKLAGRRNSYCTAQVMRPARSGKGLKAAVNRAREIWRGNSFMGESPDAPPQEADPLAGMHPDLIPSPARKSRNAAPTPEDDPLAGIHPDLMARNMALAPADHQV